MGVNSPKGFFRFSPLHQLLQAINKLQKDQAFPSDTDKIGMRVLALFGLILFSLFSGLAWGTPAQDLLQQARELLGENPQSALKILDDLKRQSSQTSLKFEADLIRCEYFVDNDDATKALVINNEWTPQAQSFTTEESLKLRLCKATAEEKLGKTLEAESAYAEIFKEAKTKKLVKLQAEALLNMGQLKGYQGDYAEALTHLQAAQGIFHKEDLSQKVRITLNSIAILYGRMGENRKAIEYFKEVLEINRRLGKSRNVAVVLYNMGRRHEALNEYPQAIENFNEALHLHIDLKNKASQALVLRALGSVYNSTQKPVNALKALNQALIILESKNLVKSEARVHLEKTVSYRLLRKFDSALAELDAAELLSSKTPSPANERDLFEQRSLVYSQMGDWKKAYLSQEKFKAASDLIITNQKDNQLSRLQLKFETTRKEQANLILRQELEASSRIQLLQLAIIALGALLFSVGGFFAIRQVRLARQMRNLALTDELTQIPNRRHILAYGDEALRTCLDQKKPFSLLIFDIDHFKRVNDSYGHHVGDLVIQRMAMVSKSLLRQADKVGRIGGEEFLIILPFTTPEYAKEVAERIRDRVALTDMSDLKLSFNVTVSIGVAGLQTDPRPLDYLINLADEALYQVKQSGRNGVRLKESA